MHHSFPYILKEKIDWSLAKPTRIHAIASFPDSSCYIKREDELSSGISGSKLRKYASLIPFLKQQNIEVVGMIGGPNSNNLVGLLQLVRENGMKPHLFVREPGDRSLQGNALFLELLLREQERTFISRKDWDDVQAAAERYLQENFGDEKYILLPEGCLVPEALPGAMSLALDVLRNEDENGLVFDRVYIDAGTGLSAIGLILGFDLLLGDIKEVKKEVVVTLIAGDEDDFLQQMKVMREALEKELSISIRSKVSVRFLKPNLSPKFGSTNKTLFAYCKQVAEREGILMDPVYSLKHFAIMQEDLKSCSDGMSLFIYNGSTLGLAGFQNQLIQACREI